MLHGLVLDSLLPDLDVEREVAADFGADIGFWSGAEPELADADFVLHVRTRVDGTLMRKLTRCRAIGRYGTGLDSVDLEAADACGMAVVGVPDYATKEVAQHAVALALAVARGQGAYRAISPKESWARLPKPPALGLEGPVGIVGYGRIGQEAARLFRGLGVDVLVASRRQADIEEDGIAKPASLGQLLAETEVVSLHTALVPETRHMIGEAALRAMRPDAILVNTARGALVDSAALLAALRDERIRGAGLDVFEADGDIDWWSVFGSSGLNVVLTPHIAWYSSRSVGVLRREAVIRTIEVVRAAEAKATGV